MELFPNEAIDHDDIIKAEIKILILDEEINQKYRAGEVRIVSEQARYPLNSISSMVGSENYNLNPEFQRRHRWDVNKKSKLIESFIMNVPIPPIFLYEDDFSHYEVMDGLQRLTAIDDFYNDKFQLTGLSEWKELNGKKYSDLPDQVRRGIDRRYLSSIILLQETAKTQDEAKRLKQLVFERINSGGIKLSPQESRNAIYNGPMNQLCIRLARNANLCKTWNIPEPNDLEITANVISNNLIENESYRNMSDVEYVLRFFAFRQRIDHQNGSLKDYLDFFLRNANNFNPSVLDSLENVFNETIELIYIIFEEKAFWLYRKRIGKWAWLKRATTVVYDPMMYIFSQKLRYKQDIINKKPIFQRNIEFFYQENYSIFEGRSVNRVDLLKRCELLNNFIDEIIRM